MGGKEGGGPARVEGEARGGRTPAGRGELAQARGAEWPGSGAREAAVPEKASQWSLTWEGGSEQGKAKRTEWGRGGGARRLEEVTAAVERPGAKEEVAIGRWRVKTAAANDATRD